MHFEERRTTTRAEIIKVATKLFIEEGFNKTTNAKIANILGLSTGNIGFYFPSKEHLLGVMVSEFCEFQRQMMLDVLKDGSDSILAYCLEITAVAAICSENPIAKEFYVSAYTRQKAIDIIKEYNVGSAKEVFGSFCKNFNDEKWKEIENIVFGVEYGIITVSDSCPSLSSQLSVTLDVILAIHKVPKSIRKEKIDKILETDYISLGRKVLSDFKSFMEKTNEEAIQKHLAKRKARFEY